MSWCFQCGVERIVRRATGVDEDGEPACPGHQVKTVELTAIDLTLAATKERIREEFQPAAAPSPVQTSAAEERMPDKVTRVCSCGCGGELRSRWSYLKGHNKAEGGAALPTPKKARKAKKEPAQIQLGPDHLALDLAKVLEESDPFIVVRLRQSQISRLLGLLLQ